MGLVGKEGFLTDFKMTPGMVLVPTGIMTMVPRGKSVSER